MGFIVDATVCYVDHTDLHHEFRNMLHDKSHDFNESMVGLEHLKRKDRIKLARVVIYRKLDRSSVLLKSRF